VKRLGVVGSMVWDTIYDRDPAQPAVEEWGGISYSLAALDATLGADWQIVPLVKVGRDLAARANAFLRSLRHVAPGARFVEVPAPNNRVTLRYYQLERRCEQMAGGVPPWLWPELGPLVADLDAVYVNFISGYEMDLATAQLLRHSFPRFLYADLHSLFLGKDPDGTRVPQRLPNAPAWFGCFDVVQLNEEELLQLGQDPLAVAAGALATGCDTLVVTLGSQGAVYFTGRPIRTARIPAEGPPVGEGDPTGCGDVFGASVAASLLAGTGLDEALRLGTRMGARNVTHRGATGLRDHLLGKLAPR
jgi:pfkB family carbohydrate kinase